MENTDFAFGIHGQNDPILTKEKAANFMKIILNEYGLSNILEGKRGTHSIRKMTTTRARICGCSKDETNTRHQWKQRRQQYLHDDMILPWPYAKVDSSLCKGGPIHYQVRLDNGILED